MRLPRRERDRQRLARREQVPLADDVRDRARPHPLGERRRRRYVKCEEVGHARAFVARRNYARYSPSHLPRLTPALQEVSGALAAGA